MGGVLGNMLSQSLGSYNSSGLGSNQAAPSATMIPQQSQIQNQAPRYTPPVQTTKQTSNGNTSNNNSNNSGTDYQAQWAAAGHSGTAPVGYHGESHDTGLQGVSADELNQLNNLFSGSMNYLTNYQQNVIPQWQTTQQGAAQDYYNTQAGLLPGQQQQLMAPIQQNQQAFQGQEESAAASAQRAYQGLQQQAQSGYGAGSSTGGALNDLAAQQFAINSGQLQQQSGQGALEFASEGNQVGQFIAQKKADLDNWFGQAKLQIQNDAQAMLQQVNQQIGLTQDAKTQAALGILQNVQQQNNAIAVANDQFTNNLQLFEATQAQNSANANAGQANTAQNNNLAYSQLMGLNSINANIPAISTNLSMANPQQLSGGLGGSNNDYLSMLGGTAQNSFSLPQPGQGMTA